MNMPWLEIKSDEDLPPSGGRVLCYEKKRGRFIAQYAAHLQVEVEFDGDDLPDTIEADHENERYCLKPGWYELEEQDGHSEFEEVWMPRKVTHWQPLPIAP